MGLTFLWLVSLLRTHGCRRQHSLQPVITFLALTCLVVGSPTRDLSCLTDVEHSCTWGTTQAYDAPPPYADGHRRKTARPSSLEWQASAKREQVGFEFTNASVEPRRCGVFSRPGDDRSEAGVTLAPPPSIQSHRACYASSRTHPHLLSPSFLTSAPLVHTLVPTQSLSIAISSPHRSKNCASYPSIEPRKGQTWTVLVSELSRGVSRLGEVWIWTG